MNYYEHLNKALNHIRHQGEVKYHTDENGVKHPCKYGTPDGPDDFVKECELCQAEFQEGFDDPNYNEEGWTPDDHVFPSGH